MGREGLEQVKGHNCVRLRRVQVRNAGENRIEVKWRVIRVPEQRFRGSKSFSKMVKELLADD